VQDALRKRLIYGDAVQHNPNDCMILEKNVVYYTTFGEKFGMASVICYSATSLEKNLVFLVKNPV
jgi:hypothetical protein